MQPRSILLWTCDTRGEVEPFVTLARGLQSAGYRGLLANSRCAKTACPTPSKSL